jgi:hypothetical protein
MQIAFLTFLLGLVAGAHTVAVSPGPDVAAVELRLDDAVVARLQAPSWRHQVDFGAALLPHHLEAVALDAAGREAGRVEQWINVPGAAAQVEITIDKAAAGEPRRAHLAWQSISSDPPRAAKLTLDGQPVPLDAHFEAVLPPRPPDSTTAVLSVELRFADGVVARRDLALGRDYDDAVATELTAMPIWLRGGAPLPPVAGLETWFRDQANALHVDSVDAGDPRVIAVRDPVAAAILREKLNINRSRDMGKMPPGGMMSYIWPGASAHSGSGLPTELFDGSSLMDAASLGIPFILARTKHPDAYHPRLADAVAVAGLHAAAVGAPRAILLALAPGTPDYSRFSGPVVRRYLAAIRVPLLVWSAGPPSAAMKAAWGDAEDITNRSGLLRAGEQLTEILTTQRIVWLAGRHLPQRVSLAPGVTAVQLDPPPAR